MMINIESSVMVSRSQRRCRQSTDRKIMNAGFIEFSDVGFDAASITKIMDRAGYAQSLFNKNWSTKAALFLAIFDEWQRNELEVIVEIMRKAGAGEINEAVGDMLQHFAHGPSVYRACLPLARRRDRAIDAAWCAAFNDRVKAVTEVAPGFLKAGFARSQVNLSIIEHLASASDDFEFPIEICHRTDILKSYLLRAVSPK